MGEIPNTVPQEEIDSILSKEEAKDKSEKQVDKEKLNDPEALKEETKRLQKANDALRNFLALKNKADKVEISEKELKQIFEE